MPKICQVTDAISIANHLPFTLIAGPCAIESESHALDMADRLKTITDILGIPFIYKSSFDKANRSSFSSKRGIGLEEGLQILQKVKSELGLPVITDVHLPEQCSIVAEVVDMLQIPAFLCRQSDLLAAAAQTRKPVNIKKGQFLAPWDMEHVVAKMHHFGNDNIAVCERGSSFGYNTLVSDMRSLVIMAAEETGGTPVIFDATHSVQQPGGRGTTSGGQREFVYPLARAAVAVGVAGLFMETHQDPDSAPSDGPNMVQIDDMPKILQQLQQIDRLMKQ